MKLLRLLTIVLIVFLPLSAMAFDASSVSSDSIYSPIVALYDNLIDVIKITMRTKVQALENSAIDLLTAMAVAYLVFRVAKSYIRDEPFRTDVFQKIVLFVVLTVFLQFDYFEKYILEPLEMLFNGLPAMFSNGSSSGSSIENVLSQSGELVSNIWGKLDFGLSLVRSMIMLVPAVLAILSVISLTLVIILNVLLATLKFYLVLTLSSLFILLSFFKFTRQYMLNAFQVVVGSILNITLISIFLNMYGDIFATLVDIDTSQDMVMGFVTIIILSSVGIFIIGTISEVAQTITSSGLSSGRANTVKNLLSKIPFIGRFIK